MINTPQEYAASLRNLAILEQGLSSIRSQLADSNPSLYSISAPAYQRRIENLKQETSRYRDEPQTFELYTFVAETALLTGSSFNLRCNCGEECPLRPPLAADHVVCPRCHSRIKFLILEGSPEYVVCAKATGEPFLCPVQGSAAREPSILSQEEQQRAIRKYIKPPTPSKRANLYQLQAG